jgi:hypothetical protein
VETHWKCVPETKQYTFNELIFVLNALLEMEGRPYQEGNRASLNMGYNNFRLFVEHLLYRNLSNFDSMILLTGTKGSGKSSTAIMIARYWCKLIGIPFNPKRHMAYNNSDMMTKIELLNKFEVIVADESVRFASASDWAKRENKDLKKKLAQIRTKHLCMILCFPMKIYKLESNYLQSFVNYWCLSGDSKIMIKDEFGMRRRTPICDLLYKKNYEVLTYNIEKNEYEYKKPEKTILTNNKAEVFEIELENGLKVSATENHMFLTKNGYKALKDLTDLDEIQIKDIECKHCKKIFIPRKETMIFCSSRCVKNFNISPEERRQYMKEYNKKNKEIIKKKQHEKYEKNKEVYAPLYIAHREKNREKNRIYSIELRKNNTEFIRQRDREYRKKNYEHYIERERKKFNKYFNENINFKLAQNYRNRLRDVLRKYNTKKTKYSVDYLGCSIEELKQYLESKFKIGMSWSNHNQKGWHIDHIKPCCTFDLTKEEERIRCFHYNNLQPLWASDNLSKGGKIK